MMSLIRLAYASEATFKPGTDQSGVEPHVARILLASRRNNARQAVVGGLYYGNHRFFQYLEGEEDEVRAVYDRIRKDDRHRHIKTLLDEPLQQRTFEHWSMKYVPQADDVQRMLEGQGMDHFEPDRFDRNLCEEMIAVIRDSSSGDRLISHGAGAAKSGDDSVLTPGARRGLVFAAATLVVALVAGGTLLLP
ncbi:BLUF domain-containing protein [Marinobacter lacisalsi]|uniref:BLUF domain-containing protein n=1 Tax=Marinobacter lacisalsi TaxID=475979 RepID=A0ABV8QD99_9GAMM